MFVIQKKEELCYSEKNGSNTVRRYLQQRQLMCCQELKSSSVKQCILNPEAKFVKTHNLLVARVLVDNGKSIPARVLNSENSSIRIMKGTLIALLEPVEEVAESSSWSTESVFRVQEKSAETLRSILQSVCVLVYINVKRRSNWRSKGQRSKSIDA